MATTDPLHELWEALIAIVDADTAIRTLTGKTAGILVPWNDVGTVPLPVYAGLMPVAPEIGGTGINWRPSFRLSAFADGNGALRKVREMRHALRAAITQPALAAQNIDAAPMRWIPTEDPELPEGTRALARADVTIEFWLTE